MNLTAERLRQLLHYDQETGKFIRLTKAGAEPIGSVAGGLNTIGYWQIGVDYGRYTGHRLAWLYTYGRWPALVDHINGNRSDNRLANLREVSKQGNAENIKRPPSTNTSGYLGASRHRGGRWAAHIRIDNKSVYLGLFDTPELAHAAYMTQKRLHHQGFPD